MTEDSKDVVEAMRQLRAMGAVRVNYKRAGADVHCEVVFDSLPLRSTKPEDAEAEYQRMALASAG